MAPTGNITLMIVDDQDLFRVGLHELLMQQQYIDVVATASTGLEAADKAMQFKPDIIIMDISMPGIDGIEATELILRDQPDCKIITLTAHNSPEVINHALNAGAKGFIPKDCTAQELIEAIKSVYSGSLYLCPRTAVSLLKNIYQRNPDIDLLKKLSPRETEVVRMLALGFNNKSIAWELGLSVKTIETHRKQALAKLNIQGIADLTRFAVNCGLTPLD